MAEIDEAAAVEWFLLARRGYITAGSGNAARAALAWKARAEAAEAERDAANAKLRVMESRMKQVHAALLALMSDEQLAQSVKAR